MKGNLPVICSVMAVFLLTSCENKQEAAPEAPGDTVPEAQPAPPKPAPPKLDQRTVLGDELTGLMKKFGETVSSVKDQATWTPAKEELDKIKTRTLAIIGELKALPKPSAEQRKAFLEMMKKNEADLEKALGDKETFIGSLPEDVGRDLMQSAGDFSMTMGQAQQALYGFEGP